MVSERLDPIMEDGSSSRSIRQGLSESRRSFSKEERLLTIEGTILDLNSKFDRILENRSRVDRILEELMRSRGECEAPPPIVMVPSYSPQAPPLQQYTTQPLQYQQYLQYPTLSHPYANSSSSWYHQSLQSSPTLSPSSSTWNSSSSTSSSIYLQYQQKYMIPPLHLQQQQHQHQPPLHFLYNEQKVFDEIPVRNEACRDLNCEVSVFNEMQGNSDTNNNLKEESNEESESVTLMAPLPFHESKNSLDHRPDSEGDGLLDTLKNLEEESCETPGLESASSFDEIQESLNATPHFESPPEIPVASSGKHGFYHEFCVEHCETNGTHVSEYEIPFSDIDSGIIIGHEDRDLKDYVMDYSLPPKPDTDDPNQLPATPSDDASLEKLKQAEDTVAKIINNQPVIGHASWVNVPRFSKSKEEPMMVSGRENVLKLALAEGLASALSTSLLHRIKVPLYVISMYLYSESNKVAHSILNREIEVGETITKGAVSGDLAVVVTTSFDVMKTRMMTAPQGVPIFWIWDPGEKMSDMKIDLPNLGTVNTVSAEFECRVTKVHDSEVHVTNGEVSDTDLNSSNSSGVNYFQSKFSFIPGGGSEEHKGANLEQGYNKAVSFFLSLPVPSKGANPSGEEVNDMLSRHLPDYLSIEHFRSFF